MSAHRRRVGETPEAYRDRRAAEKAARVRAGLCRYGCARPVGETDTCEPCRAANLKHQIRYRRERGMDVGSHRCSECGQSGHNRKTCRLRHGEIQP